MSARRRLGAALTAAEHGDVASIPAATFSTESHVVGVTGPPGVGKSSLIAALIGMWRAANRSVAVLAVDPSSPMSGGALLGDRIRLGAHEADPGVFIRSMAARGHLGGSTRSAPLALAVLEASGFDVVVLETVGVGQSELEISALADTVVWCTAPGLGDDVQAAKAGVVEVADILVVNKADRGGAGEAVFELRTGLAHSAPTTGWAPMILATSARDGEGVAGLCDALDRHRIEGLESGRRARVRDERVRHALREAAIQQFSRALTLARAPDGTGLFDRLAGDVRAGERELAGAAEDLLRGAIPHAGD